MPPNMENTAQDDPFANEGIALELADLLSEDRSDVPDLEQRMFDYGHELSDIEDDMDEELGTADLREPSKRALGKSEHQLEGTKKAVSAGKGRTRVRSVSRKRRKIREIEDPNERTIARLKKLMSNFTRANKKLWKDAYANRITAPFRVRDMLTKDGKRNHNKKFPEVTQKLVWDDSRPRSLISEDNILLVAAYPNFLGTRAHDIIFDALMAFGRLVRVSIKNAANRNGRDAFESYIRTTFDGELSGVFQLVALWKPMVTGEDTQAGPARDVIKNVINLNLSIDLLRKLRIVTQRIDDMYRVNDPAQHAFLRDARVEFEEKYAWYNCLAAVDPSFFHGRSLIYNRETPVHADRRDPKQNLTPILTVGNYKTGVLHIPELGLDIAYGPGTLVMLRGALLKHSVTFSGGQRVSIAHFLHQYMLDELDESIPPLNDVVPPS